MVCSDECLPVPACSCYCYKNNPTWRTKRPCQPKGAKLETEHATKTTALGRGETAARPAKTNSTTPALASLHQIGCDTGTPLATQLHAGACGIARHHVTRDRVQHDKGIDNVRAGSCACARKFLSCHCTCCAIEQVHLKHHLTLRWGPQSIARRTGPWQEPAAAEPSSCC